MAVVRRGRALGGPTVNARATSIAALLLAAINLGCARLEAGAARNASSGGDQWYEGGTVPRSTYNSYELHVTPALAGAANDYFLNARDGSRENHTTWALDYRAVIKVQGGGTITFLSFDSNCRHIMNCGA